MNTLTKDQKMLFLGMFQSGEIDVVNTVIDNYSEKFHTEALKSVDPMQTHFNLAIYKELQKIRFILLDTKNRFFKELQKEIEEGINGIR